MTTTAIPTNKSYRNEHRTDGWNTCRRLERIARPAGRIEAAFAADLEADRGEEIDFDFHTLAEFEALLSEREAADSSIYPYWNPIENKWEF